MGIIEQQWIYHYYVKFSWFFYPYFYKKGAKKMRKKILITIMGTLLTLSVAGCGNTLNNNELNAQSDYKNDLR
ncbi:hypothetical protein GCM10020331_056390 [Ectobacillus funiculus]